MLISLNNHNCSMNIFYLHENPKVCAQMACDKHVVKMTCETAQLLSTAHPPALAPYKHTHVNHPCALWARQSIENYQWLLRYGINLGIEFTFRFGKTHKSAIAIKKIAQIGTSHIKFKSSGFEAPPKVVPDSIKNITVPNNGKQCPVVYAYRKHYILNCEFAEWNQTRPAPAWWPKDQLSKPIKQKEANQYKRTEARRRGKLEAEAANLSMRDFNQAQFNI